MRVRKRNGSLVQAKFDSITKRLKDLAWDLSKETLRELDEIAQMCIASMYDQMKTQEIDDLLSETAIAMSTTKPEFAVLAARVLASNVQKQAPRDFEGYVQAMADRLPGRLTFEYKEWMKDIVKPENDFLLDFFGLRTLSRSYLTRDDRGFLETPQFLWMRVAIGIHGDDEKAVRETYEALSELRFTHATPTLFNAGTPRAQLASCFLMHCDDSISSMYAEVLSDCAQISKWAGGIGLCLTDVRASGSEIKGTNGKSSGIFPFMRVLNATAKHVNQAGKRNGSIACYLEPWHADIFAFLESKLPIGEEDSRTRDLFLAVWMPDLFMERLMKSIEKDEDVLWSLMCPSECPGLSDAFGESFKTLYEGYEKNGKFRKQVKVRDVWNAILTSQMQSGVPYIVYKDAVNKRNAQMNLGTIKNSNLCVEICLYSSPDETAVCNLASIALPKCTKENAFDFETLDKLTRICVRNLNKVIDRTFYPTERARRSNLLHRPIGIGVQGLADVFLKLGMAWTSEEARELNFRIFERMYFSAVDESSNLASELGPYESYDGSPMFQGKFQFDMYDSAPPLPLSLPWDELRNKVSRTGLRNSTLLAPMPTASTSQILGNNEYFEPFTSNVYTRRTLAGDFVCVNKHLVSFFDKRWNAEVFNELQQAEGSVQGMKALSDAEKSLFLTAYELPQRILIDLAADRQRFVDQTQSMNLFLRPPPGQDSGAWMTARITSMQRHAWQRGLKTGVYYTRTSAAVQAKKITTTQGPKAKVICTDDVCTMCSA